jgi:peptide/nickel transport system substrate-binding protein
MDEKVYTWFSQTKFRQAMSSMLNRKRIAEQVYRGLAVPAHHFFARANPYYDESIRLEYTYNPERAVKLLSEIGITRNSQGEMVDRDGNRIEFTMNVGAENNIGVDMCAIFEDELASIGIKANVRPIDFQKLVEMLINTYEWEVVTVSLGPNYWPEGGSNVWQSTGNFHLWHPLQDEPATEWEAKIDALYNEGRFTLDRVKAKKIYDEYQRLILEQMPLMYIVHPLSFLAVRDKWDNVFYDTLEGLDSTYVFLKQ